MPRTHTNDETGQKITSMHTLFTALKQGTLNQHVTLEKTSPFSLFHHLSHFNATTYKDVLRVMSEFHSTAASHVSIGASEKPSLATLADMLNTDEVSVALERDINALACDFETNNLKKNDSPQGVESPSSNTQPLESQKIKALKDQLVFCGQHSASIAAMYVWLGSSMGANMISRRLVKLDSNIPTAYYTSMAGCARAWVPFKQNAEHILAELKLDNDRGVRDIVEDANTWFSFLIALGRSQSEKEV